MDEKSDKLLILDLDETLIVDDTPEKSRNNYGNAIYIKEFAGDATDEELNIYTTTY